MYPVTQPNPKGFSVTSVLQVQNVDRRYLSVQIKSLVMYYYYWNTENHVCMLVEMYAFIVSTSRSAVSIFELMSTQNTTKMPDELFNLVEDTC